MGFPSRTDFRPSVAQLALEQEWKQLNPHPEGSYAWYSWSMDLPEPTTCIDCGQPTTPGKGSARCPGCWEHRCGQWIG